MIITLPFTKSEHTSLLKQIACSMVVLYAFFLPLSTAATLILMYGILLIWLIDKAPISRWHFYWSYPLTKPLIYFAALTLIGITYSNGSSKAALSATHDVLRLSFIPILAYYVQEQKYKNRIFCAFVAALILTILATFLKIYADIPIGHRTYGNDIFKNHIVISYFMAVAFFLLCAGSYQFKQFKPYLILLAGLILYYLLFLNTGRTGYIVMYTCFAVWAWHKYGVKGMVVICLMLSLLFWFTYHFSEAFATQLNQFYEEYQHYLQGQIACSIASRIQFALNSVKLFFQRPLFGFGTGSFIEAYSLHFGSDLVITENPHNQYLNTAVELGLVGLIALIWIFFSQWKLTLQLSNYTRVVTQALFLSFFVGCIFNSWLKDFTECHFYCLMTACLIPLHENTKSSHSRVKSSSVKRAIFCNDGFNQRVHLGSSKLTLYKFNTIYPH